MKKTLCTTLAALTLGSTSSTALAQGWDFLPVGSSDYRAEPALAVVGGLLDPQGASSDEVAGIELSLNCPLIQPPSNRIRQQLSLTRYDHQGLEITSLELNPHYVLPLGSNLELGFGPGLSYLDVEQNGDDEGLFGLQAGVSLHYRRDAFFMGAEARYQITESGNFGSSSEDVDNSRVLLKVGINL